MSQASAGGLANWRGLSFELRLAVEYCVNALLDEDARYLLKQSLSTPCLHTMRACEGV